ncbi:MAG TPA: NUDIX domain-containing protein, partial [Ilumatobacteraceae bacterium]|nr:NUDIX domain-containing protein [Ilumatobacteraceae bacterium]
APPMRLSEALAMPAGRPTLTIATTWDDFVSFARTGRPPGHCTALGWVLDPHRRAILLVRHRVLGWTCPGGHVEPGEALHEAASRELREETGLRLAPVSEQPLTLTLAHGCHAPGSADHDHWGFGFRFHAASDAAVLATEPGQPAQWFAVDALPSRRPADIDAVVAHLRATDWA